MTAAIEVTDATFADDVLGSELPVIVDFWAPWCKPCRAIEPILSALAEEHEGRLLLARVNIDESYGVASRYGVLSIPTVILFAGGEPRTTVVGAQPRRAFDRAFGDWLGGD